MPEQPIKNVAILGSGAMGGIYASHFCRAGFSVYSVARGARAKRLNDQGLLVNNENVPVNVVDMDEYVDQSTNQSTDAMPRSVDLVMVAVKHHQLDEALNDVAPLVDQNTIFLSVLNGLDSEETIATRFAPANVLYCIALAMDAARQENRVTFHQAGKLVFGAADNREPSRDVVRVQQALDQASLVWETPVDMLRELWWKFMVNVGINQASALTGAVYSEFVEDGPARSLMTNLIDEVIAISQHAGINLGAEDLERWHNVLANQAPMGKTSMLQDIEARRPTELEIFAGRVIRMGRHYGHPTPFNQAAWDLLSHWSAHGRALSE